ncbi:hypothetical protein GCM10027590_10030 [Nocardiopsis nanhaiensis]
MPPPEKLQSAFVALAAVLGLVSVWRGCRSSGSSGPTACLAARILADAVFEAVQDALQAELQC